MIGRPTTPEAIDAVRQALLSEDKYDPPSVRVNLDVQQIMNQQVSVLGFCELSIDHPTFPFNIFFLPQQRIELARNMSRPPPAGILIDGPTPTPPENRRVSFTGQNVIVPIMSDNTGRQLRPVVTGIPNSPIRQQPK